MQTEKNEWKDSENADDIKVQIFVKTNSFTVIIQLSSTVSSKTSIQ